MKLQLAGKIKIAYDWLVSFQEEEGRGATCHEMIVAGVATSGTATVYTRVLQDLGLVLREDIRKPSGFLALEIRPTDANPYDEDGA